MRIKRLLIVVWVLSTASVGGFADRLGIGQVDTGRLLLGQRVDLFISIDPGDATGNPEASADQLRVYESADGLEYQEVDNITGLTRVRSLEAPLSFYMLVDNSGSMYDEAMSGGDLTRIDAATQAIRDFANSIDNRRDRIGLAVFNTGYLQLLPPGTDKAGLGTTLERIGRPAREEGYTELYAALVAAASDAGTQGRRTVVVLSDGENYPYSIYENEDHPEYGDRLYTHEDAIEAFQREGLSVFAIHYGPAEDPNLDRIAAATGGSVYRASGPDDLSRVYQDIRTTLLDEYRLSYTATMIPGDRRYVRVVYADGNSPMTAERLYFANTLFAGSTGAGRVLLFVILGAGVLGLGALLFVSIRTGSRSSSLVLIDSGGSRGIEKTIALGSTDTIIGASPQADVTIAGNPTVSEQHAVVTFEPEESQYTIVSDSPVRVNNQPTKKRVLKPGDVINIEGTIFAYDEPTEEPDGTQS